MNEPSSPNYSEAMQMLTGMGKRTAAPVFNHLADCESCRARYEAVIKSIVAHMAEAHMGAS